MYQDDASTNDILIRTILANKVLLPSAVDPQYEGIGAPSLLIPFSPFRGWQVVGNSYLEYGQSDNVNRFMYSPGL